MLVSVLRLLWMLRLICVLWRAVAWSPLWIRLRGREGEQDPHIYTSWMILNTTDVKTVDPEKVIARDRKFTKRRLKETKKGKTRQTDQV